jgi:hypothetical protein
LLENQSLNDNIKSTSSNLFLSADINDDNDEVAVDPVKFSIIKFYPAQLDFREQ